MTFTTAIQSCFQKYATWQGRARRSEFWWFALFVFGGNFVLGIGSTLMIGYGTGGSFLGGIFALGTFLPYLSVLVRRLHDTDKSGWWFWVVLVPLVGWIILIVLLSLDGTHGDNRYSSDPRDHEGDDEGDRYAPTRIPTVRRD